MIDMNGKLLRLSDTRSIFILETETGEYISNDNVIRYRNIGKDFNHKFIEEHSCYIENGIVHITDMSGKSTLHFPVIWLDTVQMKIMSLVEVGILKQE